MRSFDFLDLLGDAPEDLVESCFAEPAAPAGIRRSVWAPRIVSGAAAAACLAVVCGMGILLRDDGMTMQTSTMETVVAPETERPAATTAPAVTAAPERSEVPALTAQTAQTVQTTAALPAETTAQPAATAPAATEAPAETAPAETTLAPAETAPAETAPAPAEPQTPVFELGDVDMDGKITFVDAALVFIDIQLADVDRLDLSLLTDEQRALGDVDGKMGGLNHWIWNEDKQDYEPNGEFFPLSGTHVYTDTRIIGDPDAIFHVALYRNWLDMSDLTTEAYLSDSKYYDDLYDAWFINAEPETQQQIQDAVDFYREIRRAIWEPKELDGMLWEGSWQKYLQRTVFFDTEVRYDAGDFLKMAEEMREYF